LTSRNTQEAERLKAEEGRQDTLDKIKAATLARDKSEKDQELALTKQEIEQELEKLRQETEEIVKRAGAVDDKFIAALQAFGDKALMEKTAEAMAPLAIFRNSGVLEVFAGLLKGTPLADVLNNISSSRR
jgi:major vault protein